MNAMQQFIRKVGIPPEFGEEGPAYARLTYLDGSGTAGADADVEVDADRARVVVTVTEWTGVRTGMVRVPVMRVEFDAVSGTLVSGDEDTLPALLAAVDGMHILGVDGA